jgi:hypothetical protein
MAYLMAAALVAAGTGLSARAAIMLDQTSQTTAYAVASGDLLESATVAANDSKRRTIRTCSGVRRARRAISAC